VRRESESVSHEEQCRCDNAYIEAVEDTAKAGDKRDA
jgi:hypothetical protein